MKIAIVFSLLISAASAIAEELTEAQTQAVAFVSDVTAFEGMFYSVYDYCAPFSGKSVAELAKKTWIEENKRLLDHRDAVMEALVATLAHDADIANDLNGWQQGIFSEARDSDRLYTDIRDVTDMQIVCSKRLGVMNSESMSFQRVSPDSFSYWTNQRGIPAASERR